MDEQERRSSRDRIPDDVEPALAPFGVVACAVLLDSALAGESVSVWPDGRVVRHQSDEIQEADGGTPWVRLALTPDEFLVSRSQARAIARRIEGLLYVQIDLDGVDEIGQAFADELFRVFPLEHPDVRVVPINTAPTVARMIARVTAGAKGG